MWLSKEAYVKMILENKVSQNLANALRTDGMLGKKLDVLSGQVAARRLDKKGRK
jgi:hypothetical protein